MCLSCGVGRVGLEGMIILVGSDLVTRRERREGVLSGAAVVVEDCGGFLAAAAVEAVEDGCVDVWSPPCPWLPNENVELIDAPMMI